MDMIYMDSTRNVLGELVSPTLDLQFGGDQNDANDFELSHKTSGLVLQAGMYVSVEGTEYGGTIDEICPTVADGRASYTVKGRTWHGILAGKIIQPDAGTDRLTVNGEANTIIRTIISRIGLGGIFTVATESSGLTVGNYSFRRYINAYLGLRMMLTGIGARLDIANTDGVTTIRAVPATTYGGADSDQRIDFTAEKAYRRTNHLIGLGKGELKARAVSHWYADKNGAVSQKQTLTGVDEIVETYELTSSEGTDLSDKTRDKLKEMQAEGNVDIDVPDDIGLHVDDIVKAYDAITGISVTSNITRMVVKLDNSQPTIEYTAGVQDWPDEQE
ncbi:hypothetical protein KIH77_08880 [Bifidobacterium sp. 82T24]|uniref:siphovirus ReqiPepy6 Gp37-like family protein n=1 Tax=Bifidobacterium pluvialisilvae TaxID=2834436 RepID=UPI001C5A32A9|nr:siphovirus ReqiPepy6 Gp37-like family protein [Bifidobacterium pluvialisilvae]MBW3088834.1 hypothetical protein [Bifidobacterium pluvialisilvae]